MTSFARPDHFLDITDQVCPLTFVRTRLRLDSIAPGEVLEVRLNAGEPLDNVPRSARELGHEVVSLEADAEVEGVYRLLIRKA